MAVTSPLGGTTHTISRPCRTCMYGSRFETTKMRLDSHCSRMWTASRSAVHRFSPAYAQTGFGLRCRPRGDQALRHRLHFARQRGEDAEFSSAGVDRIRSDVPAAQPAQPLSHARQRAHQEPAHHDKGDGGDQNHQRHDAPETPAPKVIALAADISRIGNKDQRPFQLVPVVKGENVSSSHCILPACPKADFLGSPYAKRPFQPTRMGQRPAKSSEDAGRGQKLTLRIENGQPQNSRRAPSKMQEATAARLYFLRTEFAPGRAAGQRPSIWNGAPDLGAENAYAPRPQNTSMQRKPAVTHATSTRIRRKRNECIVVLSQYSLDARGSWTRLSAHPEPNRLTLPSIGIQRIATRSCVAGNAMAG